MDSQPLIELCAQLSLELGSVDPFLGPHSLAGLASATTPYAQLAHILVGTPWRGRGRGPSLLNNDGTPLELCISLSSAGVRLKLLGDPHTGLAPAQRFEAAIRDAQTLVSTRASAALFERFRCTMDATLPPLDRLDELLPNGAIWLAGELGASGGAALYTCLEWAARAQRWQLIRDWLQQMVSNPDGFTRVIESLSPTSSPICAAVAGGDSERYKVKVYARFDGNHLPDPLPIDGLNGPRVGAFLSRTVQGRVLPASSYLGATAFTPNGELSSVKLDVCGHCVPRTPRHWQETLTDLESVFELPKFPLEDVLEMNPVEVAYVGVGVSTHGVWRLNVYLKSSSN